MDEVRARLLESRAGTEALIADLEAEAAAIADSTAESPDDEHDAEGSTVGYERARVGALLARERSALTEIEAALERAALGEYGSCEQCGAPIGADRLVALPTTTTCVTCAARGAGASGASLGRRAS
jgi:DnaK suppressor protein